MDTEEPPYEKYWPSPSCPFLFNMYGTFMPSATSSGSAPHKDLAQLIFHKLNESENQMHDLLMAAPLPKGPPFFARMFIMEETLSGTDAELSLPL